MRVRETALPGVLIVEPLVFRDARGFFVETWHERRYAEAGIRAHFVQDNHSRSIKGTVRGLHWQERRPQAKLVRVVEGEVFDVAVDIRQGSPTYGRWVSAVLSERDHRMLYIPVGFAHGYCALSDEADFVYKVSAEYAPEQESGILWNDPALAIEWPVAEPVLSAKDLQLPLLASAAVDFVYLDEAVRPTRD